MLYFVAFLLGCLVCFVIMSIAFLSKIKEIADGEKRLEDGRKRLKELLRTTNDKFDGRERELNHKSTAVLDTALKMLDCIECANPSLTERLEHLRLEINEQKVECS